MIRYLIIAMTAVSILAACGPKETPRKAAFDFIYAVLDGDSLAIEHHLDLDAMVTRRMTEFTPADTLTPEVLRRILIGNLTGDGGTRLLWKNQQIIVNQEFVNGDSAQVEMTFIDQTTGKTEYSMIYLYRTQGRWRVYFYL